MKPRPLVWVATAFVLGAWLAARGLLPGFVVPFTLASAGLLAATLLSRRSMRGVNPWPIAPICIAICGAAALYWNARHQAPPGDPLSRLAVTLPENLPLELEGVVRSAEIVLPIDDYTQVLVDVDRIQIPARGVDTSVSGGLLVRWSNPDRALFAGDRVAIRGTVELDLSRINPSTPSYEDYLRRHGVHSAVRVRGPLGITLLETAPAWQPMAAISRFRNDLAHRLAAVMPESAMPFVLTVWLGDRQRTDSAEYEAYVHSGTAHILSVSGVHTAIIWATLRLILGVVFGGSRPRLRGIISMTSVFLFALMAGASVPSLRAAAMVAIYVLADVFDREPDAPTALSLSALGFIGYDPDNLFDASFQLSFLSIASILLFTKPIETRLIALPQWLRVNLATGIAVQFLPLPIALSIFGVFPIVAPLVNLLVVPLLGIVLWLSFLTSFFALIRFPADILFAHATAFPIHAIKILATWSASVPAFRPLLSAPSTLAIVAYCVAVACLFMALTARRRPVWIAGTLAAFVATFALWTPLRLPAEVVFLDVSHGDATFVRSPGGDTMLVDAGNRSEYGDTGQRVVAPFLRSNHVKRLDYVVITHDDLDHIGGIPYVLRHYDVGTVCVAPFVTGSELETEVKRICAERGIPIRVLARGDALSLAGAQAEVLHPPRDNPGSNNDNSIVLRVTWPGLNVLLTGDIEIDAERRLAETNCDTDILKIPHHGSQTSSSRLLLNATTPIDAIVSTGRRPGGKVLRESVLSRYKELGIRVHRTDYHGGIRIRASDNAVPFHVESARDLRGYPHR